LVCPSRKDMFYEKHPWEKDKCGSCDRKSSVPWPPCHPK
jgi:hypothetical protein